MANTERVDKPCEDCGNLMMQVPPIRKYCYACADERRKIRRKQNKAAKKTSGEPIILGTPIPNPNRKYCTGCIYWSGAYESSACCNYIFCVGHSRPCPPGKDCTEKVTGRRRRKKAFDTEEVLDIESL